MMQSRVLELRIWPALSFSERSGVISGLGGGQGTCYMYVQAWEWHVLGFGPQPPGLLELPVGLRKTGPGSPCKKSSLEVRVFIPESFFVRYLVRTESAQIQKITSVFVMVNLEI